MNIVEEGDCITITRLRVTRSHGMSTHLLAGDLRFYALSIEAFPARVASARLKAILDYCMSWDKE